MERKPKDVKFILYTTTTKIKQNTNRSNDKRLKESGHQTTDSNYNLLSAGSNEVHKSDEIQEKEEDHRTIRLMNRPYGKLYQGV